MNFMQTLQLGLVWFLCCCVVGCPSSTNQPVNQVALDEVSQQAVENTGPVVVESDDFEKQSKLRDQLHAALQSQDFELAEELVKAGADVNLPFSEKRGENKGTRILGYVCNAFSAGFRDRNDAAMFLLEHGADPNLTDDHGWPPIANAVWSGEISLMEILHSKGADLQIKMPGPWPSDIEGFTLLHIAALKSRVEPVRWLIERGVELDAKHGNGRTALMLAASGGRTEVVRLLLDKGALKELIDNRGRTALDLAKKDLASFANDAVNRKRYEETIELLEE